ncbi:hypothetical protein ACH42_10130 [Endozoicomonas sp. (ex Bugula neritina AB1)]|nr:hypothetical protein ACH42_10130 [Endozoicomonas sp. (ex Bugula neritina AB1)]
MTEPSIQELDSIYQLIKPHTRVTPLIKVESLSELIEGKVWIKPESLQKTGAFKFRGALYRLMTLSKEAKKQGVTAYSSGNFARGLATAGKLLNISVNLVMPHDAPENKIISARQQGATVTLCSSQTPSREEAASLMAAKIAKEQQQTLLHPFDDLTLIKGQASVAVELKQQLSEAEIQCQQILCPVGGGSLVAGTSMVFKNNTQITAVEAEGYAGMQLSLAHQLQSRAKGDALCECDALQALEPGKENLDIALRNRVNSLVVSAPAVRQAMKLAFDELKLVLEPSGAISLAAIIEKPELFRHTTLTVIATGGNVDHGTFASALTE